MADWPSSARDFPGFEHVYRLGEPGSSRAFRAGLELTVEQAFAVTRGELRLDRPVQAKWRMGSAEPSDVIMTTLAVPLLLGPRVVDLLLKLGVKGWGSYEVALTGKSGEAIAGYSGLVVHGRCGRIDNSRSVETTKQYPGGTFPVWKGLYFDPATWDGSELFMAAGRPGWIFVVESLRRELERAKVKNIIFEALSEMVRGPTEMKIPL